jgi:hypothetical protein
VSCDLRGLRAVNLRRRVFRLRLNLKTRKTSLGRHLPGCRPKMKSSHLEVHRHEESRATSPPPAALSLSTATALEGGFQCKAGSQIPRILSLREPQTPIRRGGGECWHCDAEVAYCSGSIPVHFLSAGRKGFYNKRRIVPERPRDRTQKVFTFQIFFQKNSSWRTQGHSPAVPSPIQRKFKNPGSLDNLRNFPHLQANYSGRPGSKSTGEIGLDGGIRRIARPALPLNY